MNRQIANGQAIVEKNAIHFVSHANNPTHFKQNHAI